MSALWGQLPSLVALAAHVAICVTAVSLVGAAALWICRGQSAPLRHSMALGFLVASLAVPAIAALYQYRLLRFDFAFPRQPIEGATTAMPSTGPGAVPVEESTAAGTLPDNGPNWSFIACAALALVWGTGIAIGCVRTLLVNRRQRQYLASLWPVTDAAALELAGQLRVVLGIGRHVQLRSSRDAPWPFTVGLFRPSVIVPGELLQEDSRSRLEAVLIHELAHVRRLDCGIAAIEGLARLVFWWNPLVAALASQLDAAREEICDGYVLAHAGDGASLAKYLLCSAEKAAHVQPRFAVALSLHDPLSLRKRITQLLAGDRNTMIRISSLAACALIVAALAFAFTLTHGNYAHAQLQFGPVVNLGPSVNTTIVETSPTITTDGLSLLFHRYTGPNAPIEILEATRSSTAVPFENVVSAGAEVNSAVYQGHPAVSEDGLTLLYSNHDNTGLYQAIRTQRNVPFSGVTSLGDILPGQPAHSPSLSADGLTLFFTAWDTNNIQNDIYQATRPTLNDPWGNVVMLGPAINVPGYYDAQPSISADGLMLFFNSNRPGGFGQFDIYVATRPSLDAPWEPAINLGTKVNTVYDDKGPEISADGNLLYFDSNRPGGAGAEDLFMAQVIPEPSTGMLLVSVISLLVAVTIRYGPQVPRRSD